MTPCLMALVKVPLMSRSCVEQNGEDAGGEPPEMNHLQQLRMSLGMSQTFSVEVMKAEPSSWYRHAPQLLCTRPLT